MTRTANFIQTWKSLRFWQKSFEGTIYKSSSFSHHSWYSIRNQNTCWHLFWIGVAFSYHVSLYVYFTNFGFVSILFTFFKKLFLYFLTICFSWETMSWCYFTEISPTFDRTGFLTASFHCRKDLRAYKNSTEH